MHPALIPMLGLFQPAGSNLVAMGSLTAPASLIRAQAATFATALGSDGVTWQAFGADLPRFHGAARRLLTEGQRTNALRNPRGEGAVAGLPGTVPTNATMVPPAGLTREMLAPATVNGVTLNRIRIFGTATADATAIWGLDSGTAIAVAPGETWTQSAFVALEVASGAAPTVKMANRETRADGTTNNTPDSVAPDLVLGAVPARFTRTTTMAPLAAFVTPGFRVGVASGAAYNFTLWIGWPQMERGPFASSPILPPVGTPGGATCGADILTAPLAGLGIGGAGACTLLWSGVVPQPAGAAPQALCSLDDGSPGNRFCALNTASGAAIVLERFTAGAASSVAVGSYVANTPFRFGLTLNGAGRAAMSLNGGAAVAVTGGPVAGLTTLRLGNIAGGGASLFAETALFRVIRGAMSDAALQAQVSALP